MVNMDEQQQQQHNRHQSKASSSFSSQSMVREIEREKKLEEEEILVKEKEKENEEKAKVAKSLPTFLGRHRMAAAISQLNIQITIIQEELNELESVGQSSIVCKELISSLETIPDPLLPMTDGPIDVNWDRWFRGAHNSKSHKRWI